MSNFPAAPSVSPPPGLPTTATFIASDAVFFAMNPPTTMPARITSSRMPVEMRKVLLRRRILTSRSATRPMLWTRLGEAGPA
jgi:hypothetical protein